MESLEKPPLIVEEFAKKLPRFPDGRIDYSESESAPVLTCFVKYKDKILLLKRSRNVSNYQGKWNAISGYIDELRPLKEKVAEEVNEEIGIGPDDILTIKTGRVYEFQDESINKKWIIHTVLIELDKEPVIKLDWEHDEYVWIKPEELEKFDTVPNLITSLEVAFKD